MIALRRWTSVACLVLIGACSGDSSTSPPDPPGNGEEPIVQDSASIPPTGGSVSVKNTAGFSLNVVFPSGALLTSAQVTVRTANKPAGVAARFAIEPAGLEVLKPVTVTVTFPEDVPFDPTLGL